MQHARVVVGVALVALLSACSATVGPGAATVTPADAPFDDPPVDSTSVPGGTWTGTITLHGVIDYSKEEPGHSDLDPNNTYYETWVTTEETQTDVTDTFTVQGVDDDDLTYGVHSVDFEGSAENAGTTLQRYVTVTDKQNSGCTWKQEDGTETTGSWTGSGDAVGDINFSEDGSYSINIRADSSDYAELPERNWLSYSDISANCEVNEPERDDTFPGAPVIEWVSSHLGDADVDGIDAYIEGQVNASNPGSVVDGSQTWEMVTPEGFTMTTTWHLEHSIPIVLPNSGPEDPDLY